MEKYLIIIIIVIIFYYVCKCYTHPAPALQESFIEIVDTNIGTGLTLPAQIMSKEMSAQMSKEMSAQMSKEISPQMSKEMSAQMSKQIDYYSLPLGELKSPLSLEQKSAQKTIEIREQLQRLFIAFYELVSEIKLLPETEETMKAFYALVTQVKTLKQTYNIVGVLETLVLQVKDYLQSVTPEISQILTQKLIQKLIQPLDILVRQVKIALP
jgi:hypothetical protein